MKGVGSHFCHTWRVIPQTKRLHCFWDPDFQVPSTLGDRFSRCLSRGEEPMQFMMTAEALKVPLTLLALDPFITPLRFAVRKWLSFTSMAGLLVIHVSWGLRSVWSKLLLKAGWAVRLDLVAAVEGTLMGSSSKAVLHHVKGVCSWGAVRTCKTCQLHHFSTCLWIHSCC